MKFITSNNLTYVLSTLKNKNDALYAPKDHNHEQYLTTNEDGDLVIDGSVIADNIPKVVSEDVLLTISAEVLQNAVDNNIKQLESVAFVADPSKPVYADLAGTTMTSTVVRSDYIEFFVADPTMVSGFALTAESGVDFDGNNPEKSIVTLRVLNDLEITDLKLYQLEVNTMSSMCLEHDMSVVNSISMGRRGNIGQFSVALGGSCIASGQYSIAGGLACSATGSMSVAFGRGCSANGTAGLSTGQMCLAGQECFATGRQSKATGRAASALGNYCVAKGTYSLAEGDSCQANGSTSHAEGFYTIAGSAYQHVQGKYNISDTKSKYAHIVGNGTADDARSNAHTLDWNGNGWFAGNVSIGADNKQLATEEFVNNARPCYEEQGLLTYTFDGNTDGKITVAGRDSYLEHYVKISDDIDSIQYDLIEVGKVKYVTTYSDGEIKETEAQNINLCEGLDGEIGAISIDSASYIVLEDNFETLMMFDEVTFPEKGIYVAVNDGYESYYTSSISLPGSTVKQIDEKFIPDTIARVDELAENHTHSAVNGYTIWVGTQAEYNSISSKSSTTLYFIKE